MKFNKENRRRRIHYRIRNKIKGTAQRPRISIFRSNKEIYCQMVDDRNGHTLAVDLFVAPENTNPWATKRSTAKW